MERVAFSCESLKVTTRLMHVISWLLTQRAIAAGELPEDWALDPARRLGAAPTTDVELLARFPAQARGLIWSSVDLHRRVALLDAALTGEVAVVSPARSMLDRLATAF
jgi:regulator of CtrA degradation